ncbi:hypothetical protein N7G274_009882 [Stereocaulon virgatum]|uniref:Uncharacterized protein n=1 Tax=Stereocaulon virgatum TaxID=373712 RepID=A0ABR3ZZ84_9LECA
MEQVPLIKDPASDVLEVPSSDVESEPDPRRYQIAMESKQVRLQPVLELLLPTITVSILLSNGDRSYTRIFYHFVKSNQATMQIIVQVISHILAMLQVSSMCAVLNLSTRYRSLHQSTSLQDICLWIALSTARVDLNLPMPRLLIVSAFVAATLLPGALWAGALSPLFVLKTQGLGNQQLPAFTEHTRANWDSQFEQRGPGHQIWNINDKCSVFNDARGLVPSCPVPTLQGPLLLSASSATTWDGGPRNHSKLDNPNWEYIGRSFGVGSSVGQLDDHMAYQRVLHYNYTETGYSANVRCIKNITSDFHFRLLEYFDRNISLSDYHRTHYPGMQVNKSYLDMWSSMATYYVEGYLPNSIIGTPELYPAIAWHEKYENITSWTTVVNDNRNMIAVAAGTNQYQELNQTQCEVFFTPMVFTISVNRLQHSINVEAQSSIAAEDIEPTGHLRANVMHSIRLLSRMTPSLYVSVLGETLSRNVERMQRQKPHLNLTEAVNSAAEDSFTAIIDDILVAYGASQLSNAQDTTVGAVHITVEAVQIGQPFYRYLVLVQNLLIILFVAFEAARTRGWRHLTRFNYLDAKSVIIASSAGGRGIAKAVEDQHREKGTQWVGDPADPIACEMRVEWDLHGTLAHTENVAIVKASDRDYMQVRKRRGDGRGRSVRMDRLDSSSRALHRSKSQ